MTTDFTVGFVGQDDGLSSVASQVGKAIQGAGESAAKGVKPIAAVSSMLDRLGTSAGKAEAMGEVNTQLEALSDNIIEFGGSGETVVATLEMIRDRAEATGEPVTLLAAASRGLVDEADNGAAALENLGNAMELSRRAGIKAEDAGKLVGRALRGEADALKEVGGVAASSAEAIAQVTDANERARLTQLALNKELNRSPSLYQKLEQRVASLNARLAIMTGHANPLGALTTGLAAFGAVGVAAFGGVAASVKAYITQASTWRKEQKATERETKRLAERLKDLQFTFGGIVTEALAAGTSTGTFSGLVRKASGAVEQLTTWLKQNRSTVAGWTQTIFKGAITVAAGIAKTVLGITALVTFLYELAAGLGPKVLAPVLGQLVDFIDGIRYLALQLGMDAVVGQMDKALSALRPQLAAVKAIAETTDLADAFKGTEGIVSMIDLVGQLEDGLTATEGAANGVNKALGRRLKTGGGGGEKKDAPASLAGLAGGMGKGRTTGLMLGGAGTLGGAAPDLAGFMAAERFSQRLPEYQRQLDAALENARIRQAELLDEAAWQTYGAAAVAAIDTIIGGTYQLLDALASGSLALKDLGVAAADMGGDMLANLGLDLVSEAVGMFAVKIGAVFQGLGAAFQALASNPIALLGIGAGLVAAGLLLKKFAGSGSVGGPSASGARSADTSAASAVQALGRRLFEGEDRSDRHLSLYIDDYEPLTGLITDTSRDDMRRRRRGTAGAFT